MRGTRGAALLLSGVLIVYGNVVPLTPASAGVGRLVATLVLAAGVLTAGFAAGLRSADLAVEPRRLPFGALVGAAVALAAGLLAAGAVLLAPAVTGAPIVFEEAQSPATRAFVRDILLLFPVQTAVPEELVFRGVLYAVWLRSDGVRGAMLGSSAVFALWHVTVATLTVRDSGVLPHDALLPLGVAVALAFLFAAGAVLALMREATRSLATPVVLHWGVVALARVAVRVAA